MTPTKIFHSILRRSVRTLASARLISPLTTALWYYRAEIGRWPDVRNPRDLNEKLIWLQFNTDTKIWSRLADKFEVKNFIRENGLAHILPETYGIWNNANDIDFGSLPDSFAIKSTNGTAQTIIVSDKKKADLSRIRSTIRKWARKTFGLADAEPHYTRIPFRIMAEQLLSTNGHHAANPMLIDYKFMCFNGVPLYCLVCSERDPKTFHSKFSFYSIPDWKLIPDANTPGYASSQHFPAPENLREMIDIATRLSSGFPFVRVDLYNINGRTYFSELTFTPAAARNRAFSPQWLRRLGDLIPLH